MIDAMTVKMMTAAALAVSGAAAGQYQASQLTKREEMIAELISGIRLFRNEIYYTHDRLERVAQRLTSYCSGCCVLGDLCQRVTFFCHKIYHSFHCRIYQFQRQDRKSVV